MCNINDKKQKEKRIRETAEALYEKRYQGIVEKESYMYPNFLKEEENEYGKFSATFIGGGIARPKEVFFTEDLLEELNDIAEESNVELSTLINCYLLQMLERNKRTTEHTKARNMYVKNTLFSISEYISDCEKLEEFKANIFDKEFIKHKEITYKNTRLDEEIYIKNFLLNKGYSLNQIEEIEKKEKEIQGTFMSPEGEVMKPITIDRTLGIEEIPSFSLECKIYKFIPIRLGLHYILLNKVDHLNNYEDIEIFFNSKLKGDKNIWGLYVDYYNKELI